MSLPYFVHADDYIVSPRCVARLRMVRREGGPPVVKVRLIGHGPDEEIEGAAAEELFGAFLALASRAGAAAAEPGGPGIEAIDSHGGPRGVVRDPVGDEAGGAE